MTRRAQEMDSSNQLLKDEIEQEKQKGGLLETDLVNVENRLRQSLAQMGAQEKTAAGLAAVNQEDQEMLMKRLADITTKSEKVNERIASARSNLRVWTNKLEDEKIESVRAKKHLEEERVLTSKLRDQVEAKLDVELQQKSRVQMLEGHNSQLSTKNDAQATEEAELTMAFDEVSNNVDILTQEVRGLKKLTAFGQ